MKRRRYSSMRLLTRLVLGLCLLIGLSTLMGRMATPTHAAAATVVSACTETALDSAISSATNGATIAFGCSGTITLGSPLVINQSITLDGSGQQVTLDGQKAVQVLQVNSGVNFALNALTIANGSAYEGGGLINNGGSVNITNSTFSGNSAHIAGGLYNSGGNVIITDSTFTNNAATTGGAGGLDNASHGRVVITGSTFANNSANSDAGGGIFNLSGSVSITNSTFSNNMSTNGFGGGIYNQDGLTITNSTFANNSVGFSGAALDNSGGVVSISNSTIANNTGGGAGGGLLNSSGSFSIGGSIVANNHIATTFLNNCTGSFSSNGYNLESGTDCGFIAAGDLQSANPLLDPNGLHSNGGYTQTIALQQGSPAIDAEASGCPATDQRGVPRPDSGESSCDMGAYETEYAAPDTTAPTLQLPSTMTVNATSPQGAYVAYTVSATDPDNPSSQLTISCTPASGSLFAVTTTTVQCSASDPAGNSTTGSFSVVVLPTLTASATSVTATEGQAFNLVVGTGTAFGTTGPLTASINWGDGSNSAGTVTLTGNGIYSVIGSHTYGEEGPFTLTIAVNDSGGHSATAGGTATVSDATLSVSKSTVAIKGKGATLQATFMDADPNGTVSDYSASINWGDGTTPSAGTIGTNSGGNGFTVTGTHTYTKRGTFSATMTITDAGGSHVTTPLTITV